MRFNTSYLIKALLLAVILFTALAIVTLTH